MLKQGRGSSRDGSEASRDEFEFEMIEAACRAVLKGQGAITRIRVCLPGHDRHEPDRSLQQVIERLGEQIAVSMAVEREGDMRVVLIGTNDGTGE